MDNTYLNSVIGNIQNLEVDENGNEKESKERKKSQRDLFYLKLKQKKELKKIKKK